MGAAARKAWGEVSDRPEAAYQSTLGGITMAAGAVPA